MVIAVIKLSNSSLFSCQYRLIRVQTNSISQTMITFNFFTRLSMARFEKLSLSPPCRWHIKLCTMLRQASALVGLLLVISIFWLPNLWKENTFLNWHAAQKDNLQFTHLVRLEAPLQETEMYYSTSTEINNYLKRKRKG